MFGFLSWKYIETPFRKQEVSGQILRSKILITSFIFLILIASVGLLGHVQNGWYKERISNSNGWEEPLNIIPALYKDSSCINKYENFKSFSACRASISNKDNNKIYLIGDSHSISLFDAGIKNIKNYDIINIGQWSCLPATGIKLKSNNCDLKRKILKTFLSTNIHDEDIIFFVGYWQYLLSGTFEKDYKNVRSASYGDKKDIEEFKSEFKDLIKSLPVTNKNIFILEDIPILPFDITRCKEFLPIRKKVDCSLLTEDAYSSDFQAWEAGKSIANESSKIKTVSIKELFCYSKSCKVISENSSPFYKDSDHLSKQGADRIIKYLNREFINTKK